MLDLSGEFGQRVARRLNEEIVAWLTTVRADGTPQPSPIWFLWDGETILIYSQPNTAKIRNIRRNPKVAFNFDGDGHGGDIVVLTCTAMVDESAPPGNQHSAYLAKYREHIARIGMEPDGFAASYSTALRLTPQSVRGH